tara:strand:- start:52340 stop:52918 length:579 start_codon:yes stop_codon:yes gene_type:complete
MGRIIKAIKESINLKEKLLTNEMVGDISVIVGRCITALKRGNAIYWCGNGGSAADAQHLAAELSGRFYYDRPPLHSEALHCNTSYLTAVANDYTYDKIYSRLIDGIGKPGDVLIGMSTSGKSLNIINAFSVAKKKGLIIIGLTGESPELPFSMTTDEIIKVPSNDTPRIQESHMLIGHIICQLIEEEIYPKP